MKDNANMEISDGAWKNIIAFGVMVALILVGFGGCSYWFKKGERLRFQEPPAEQPTKP